MFRVTLGLATATFFGLAAASPASAGCCGSNWGWGGGWGVNSFGGGCCNSGYVYAQPQYYVQPAPIVVQAPPPVIVQAPPQQVIVQQSQPEVIFQQAAYALVPRYTVNQGPYYAGPDVIGYPQTQYYADEPVRPYPYVNGYNGYNGYVAPRPYYGRPSYRGWRYGYRANRPWVGPRVYGGYRYHRRAISARAYVGPKKAWH